MSYSREIEQRIDALRPDWPGVFKQKMFGGLGYMLDGHICVGVFKDYLIVRCGPEATADALSQPGARPFDVTGRAMHGWVMVEQSALEHDEDLAGWIDQAEAFVRTLPAK